MTTDQEDREIEEIEEIDEEVFRRAFAILFFGACVIFPAAGAAFTMMFH